MIKTMEENYTQEVNVFLEHGHYFLLKNSLLGN
jgi:hypothetical protein